MLNQLLGSPVLMFVVCLPVAFMAMWLVRSTALAGSLAATSRLIALAICVAAVLAHLYFAFVYLLSPNFTDHIEPNTAVVGWLWANGGQVYHSVEAAERYAFLYGPLAYIATGISYYLFDAETLSAKLPGFVFLIVAIGSVATAIRNVDRSSWLPMWAALGYLSLLALFFKNFSFWAKPDSLMLAASAVGLLSCTLANRRMAWLLCGIALGLAVNAKITGAIYFLPYFAWFLQRDGLRAPLLAGCVALLVAALPFLNPDSVSLTNYLAWLQASGAHGLSRELFIQNVLFAVFACIPAVLFVFAQRETIWANRWVLLASVVALGLIQIAASKPGSGPHHYLAFLPALAFIVALLVRSVASAAAEVLESEAVGFAQASRAHQTIIASVLIALLLSAGIKAGIAVYYGLGVVRSQALGAELVQEIDSLEVEYPGRNIYMGYGDGSRYTWTFVRNTLAYRGHPYLVDASALMDFQFSGIDIPQATIERMLADSGAVWLIPAGQAPFTIVSWYYRNSGGMVFSSEFRAAFSTNFQKVNSTTHYDIYTR